MGVHQTPERDNGAHINQPLLIDADILADKEQNFAKESNQIQRLQKTIQRTLNGFGVIEG